MQDSPIENPLNTTRIALRHFPLPSAKVLVARGFTLIEMVIALVVIAIAGAVLLSVFITPIASSADPQLRTQARAIASAYLDEILLREYGAGPGDCNGPSRSTYDTIWCYDGLSEAPRDQFGNPISALSGYTVSVDVSAAGGSAADISVRVRRPAGVVDLALSGRRGNY
jgi:MSHA pilin protein MshD